MVKLPYADDSGAAESQDAESLAHNAEPALMYERDELGPFEAYSWFNREYPRLPTVSLGRVITTEDVRMLEDD